MRIGQDIVLKGITGSSGARDVILGSASASLLHALSFADVLDEETGRGYQRRFSTRHSLDFRRYIQRPGSTTIPLTFNLRPGLADVWRVVRLGGGLAEIRMRHGAGKVLSQVDCQHRLGHLGNIDVLLPFMVLVGLTEREELEVFNVINSKARGLSGSLLDFHSAHLAEDLGAERPELLIALYLNDVPSSPWYKQLDLGGSGTTGMKRRASLRTMQKAVRRFLSATGILRHVTPSEAALIVLEYWIAVAEVLHLQWSSPRRHYLTKGIGVYALMGLLGDFWKELSGAGVEANRASLAALLADFAGEFDWSAEGSLKGLGGESGAVEALQVLRAARITAAPKLTLVTHA